MDENGKCSIFIQYKKKVGTCQKLAFKHPIVVLKSGLKNNWMKKLDRVNWPLKQSYFIADETRDFSCIPVLPENFQSAPSIF